MKLFVPRIAAVSVAALCRCNRSRAVSKLTFVASLVLFYAIGLLAPARAGAVTIAWSPVGNPGNAGELSGEGAGGFGSTAILGAVGYNYRMGTYDVTASQYVEFLNAKDSSGLNPLGLYRSSMSNATYGGISFSAGNANGSKYSVKSGRGNHPVNYLTGYAAYRFANWLNNGQGSGDTESGAYTLLGGTPTPSNALSIPRNAGATVFLPTEDEWYKAAYYNPGSSSYFHYPTSSNTQPTWTGPTAVPNSANYGRVVGNLTDVGAYSGTTSPYGAFDMGGNVYQWIEGDNLGPYWRLRGGSWIDDSIYLESKNHSNAFDPTDGLEQIGFRVASIPEPSTGVLAIVAGGLIWVLRKRLAKVAMHRTFAALVLICEIGLLLPRPAMAVITISTVPVGNVGNANDPADGDYYTPGVQNFGSVGYAYNIGKYEVTEGQYSEFLNAVAKADPNGLYSTLMGGLPNNYGINIQRTGSSPNYSYNVPADWANRPVSFVSFWDAARFANWLDNGQPTGAQGPGTTEDGAYHDVGNQTLFGRNAGAKFFIPTNNEWYKAAYHDQTAGLAASYFQYPTGSNTAPSNTLPDSGNHANFYDAFGTGNNAYTIGPPYYRTNVGEFANSASPYGTFDQGGNVTEWNETADSSTRGLRGGRWNLNGDLLHASLLEGFVPAGEDYQFGFRVASIPEPSTGVLGVIACGLMWWWRKRFK